MSGRNLQPIANLLRDKRDVVLDTTNPAIQYGFTQVPNFILENPDLSDGAKVTYALFLRYAWDDEGAFPGQETMASHLGCHRATVARHISDLKKVGYLEVVRRGLGKTNLYILKFNPQRDNKKT